MTSPISLKVDVVAPDGGVIWTTGTKRAPKPDDPSADCDLIFPIGGSSATGIPILPIDQYGTYLMDVYMNGERVGGAKLRVSKPPGMI